VADISGNRVSRLDPKSGRVLAEVKTGASPCGMAYGAGSIWVEDYAAADVTRIMLPSLETKRYRVGNLPYDVAFAAGAAWVTNYGDDTVTRVDAATGRRTTVEVGSLPVGIAPSGGALWVGNSGDGTISRIDAATLKVTSIRSGGSPGWTAYDGRTVWVGDGSTGQVIRVDSRTGRIVARVDVGETPNDGDVYQGALWVPDADGSLYRVELATNTPTGPIRLGAANPFVADGFDGRLWIADFKGTETFVVDLAELPGSG
jgi:YVTN family beta-propeller protein